MSLKSTLIFLVILYYFNNRISSFHFHRHILSTSTQNSKSFLYSSLPSSSAQIKLGTKVFIGNLPFTITIEDIRKLVEENVGEGLIKENGIEIAVGKKSKAPRGFVFVDCIDEEAALATADRLNEIMYHDRPLNSNVREIETETSSSTATSNKNSKKLASKNSRVTANTVFLTNIDNSLDEREILNMCEDILGTDLVKSLQILRDKTTGKPRGVCYIEFKSNETTQRAIADFNGLEVLGRILVCVEFKPKKVDKTQNLKPTSNTPSSDDEIIYY